MNELSAVGQMHRFEIFASIKYCDLETRVRGYLRSLEMTPFDRLYRTFYFCSIVTMAISCTVFEVYCCPVLAQVCCRISLAECHKKRLMRC